MNNQTEMNDAFFRSAEKLLEVSKMLEPFNELYSLLFLNNAQTLIMYLEKINNGFPENISDENIDDIVNQIEQEMKDEIHN